ncbi:class I SAM-dependent methyltransferase [Bacillus sp. REN10]|uniref:class I SAM-dependent methyltransferase n=1 Tax=Bacillus sp. REN10 TaxID=2782541 RepID=UPI00193B890D|nr:class I SAM-dependent methyltransferase [Bacillus sp. REN10]
MFIWTEDSIKWYKQAAEYTKYDQEIYQEIAPFIEETDTVSDIACGLGFISLQLAQKAKSVTAIDISAQALQLLQENIEKQAVTNIEVITSDVADLPFREQWDVVVMSFFQQSSEAALQLLQMSKKRAIIVLSNGSKTSFWPTNSRPSKKGNASELVKQLKEKHIRTQYIERDLDFGQPFHSFEEAVKFMKHYAPNNLTNDLEHHLQAHLVPMEANECGYRYYLPHIKRIGIVVIDK